MRIIRYLLLVSFFLPFLSHAAPAVYDIGEGEKTYIGNYLEYHVDESNVLGLEAALNEKYVPLNKEVLNLSIIPHTVWMRFTVKSKRDETVLLEIAEPMLEILEVYEMEGLNPDLIYKGGFGKQFSEREVETNIWLFDLRMRADVPKTILLRVKTGYPFKIPISVARKNNYIEQFTGYQLFWGIFVGIMLFALIYNLFVYFSLRDRTYLFYCFYVLMALLFYMALQGHSFMYLWPNTPRMNAMAPVLVCLANLGVLRFTFDFLDISRKQKVIFWIGWILFGLFILAGLVAVFGPYELGVVFAQLLSMVITIYIITVGVHAWIRKVPNAKFFLAAWVQFMILMAIYLMADNGVLPANKFTQHSMFVGAALEALILSLALANRINYLRKDNEQKQLEIIHQLEEKEGIQRRANEELEQKVVERTAQVVKQKNEAVRQRNRSDQLLLNILPEETAEELKSEGTATAKRFDEVTVMFTDIAGFTHKAEQLSPEKLVSAVNEIFTEFDQIIDKYGIEKIKTIGDSYMAASGLPTAEKSHALKMVNAAIEIQNYMVSRASGLKEKGKNPFEIRLGIHSGPVVAGVVGFKKFAYDIWGTTVNVASRLENAGEVNKINISHQTYNLVKDHFQCVPRGDIGVKGLGAVPMYYVENTEPVDIPELLKKRKIIGFEQVKDEAFEGRKEQAG